MKRVIKFRAYTKYGVWVEGFGVKTLKNGKTFLLDKGRNIEVVPETVGQFTGLLDRDGKEIYEGDIYQVANSIVYEIKFITELEYEEKTCGFGMRPIHSPDAWIIDTFALEHGKVIGNIYENPELLEKV